MQLFLLTFMQLLFVYYLAYIIMARVRAKESELLDSLHVTCNFCPVVSALVKQPDGTGSTPDMSC